MKTEIRKLDGDPGAIRAAASLIRKGGLVAFPTETVYGLGASALDDEAVRAVFAAKERAADNPLIVHICHSEDAFLYAEERPFYRELAARFWPGPFTMILPVKNNLIAPSVRCGLPTAAFRLPSNEYARRLIEEAGVPIAAPSANRSGRPSPTTARHVFEDMDGRIPLILDGGSCDVGIESTVLDLSGETPVLLRPGIISPADIRAVTGELTVHPAALRSLAEGEKAASPGMKYKHYAPKARVTVVIGTDRLTEIQRLYDEATAGGVRAFMLVSSVSAQSLDGNIVPCGNGDAESAAHDLFSALRTCDELGAERVFAEGYPTEDAGLGVMNRMLRAAAFDVVNTEEK